MSSPARSKIMGESPMPRAFTLVEVTISVAIAVVLMLGIAQVFRIVGDTVGTGEALATAQRDARATQAVMAHDFNTTVSDGAPFMLLSSQQQWAFRNAADLAGDKDGNPASYDPQNTGTETLQAATNYNYRSHRIDCLTFFGRGSFARQTGADASSGGISPFVSTMGGLEAMLWYGHLNLADNAGSFTVNGNLSNNSPGAGTTTLAQSNSYNTVNPNNFFATQWILGRQQIILQPPSPLYNNDTVLNPPAVIDQTNTSTDAGNIQYAYMPNSVNLSPLAYNSLAFVSNGTLTQLAGATVLSSRLDLAATSILGFRNSVQSYINSANNNSTPWWNILPGGYDSKNTRNVWRFQAQPFFLPAAGAAKVTAASMAYQSPIFVRGCTSFTVEYAGDYLNQSAPAAYVTQANQGITDTLYHYDSSTNTTTATGTTDGQIDFTYVVPVNAAPLTNTQNLVRQIRWYGLPRSTTNNTTISAGIGTGNGDVTPLRDVLTALNSVPADASALTYSGVTAAQIPTQAPFEVQLPTLNNNSTAASSDYAGLSSTPPGSAPTAMLQQPAAGASGSQYVCAWGPNDPKPKMIRITMTIDDPGGRLGEGQTYEYIYTLP